MHLSTPYNLTLDIAESCIVLAIIERFYETMCETSIDSLGHLIVTASILSLSIGNQDRGRTRLLYDALRSTGTVLETFIGKLSIERTRALLTLSDVHLRACEAELLLESDLSEHAYEDAECRAEYLSMATRDLLAGLSARDRALWARSFAHIRMNR